MRTSALAVWWLLAVACGARTELRDGADAAVADGPAVSPCARLAEAFCARLAACAPEALSNGLTGGRAIGAARCASRMELACEGWRATPGLTATAAQVDACRAEVGAASCAEVGWRYYGDDPVCASWPRVGRALGAACRYEAECAAGDCSGGSSRGCGVCRSAAPAPTQRPGEACDARRRCQYWQRCVAGVCSDRAGLGEACAGDGECDPTRGLACDRTARRCIRRPVAPDGGACLSQIVTSPDEPASAMCAEGFECLNRNDFGQGRCRALTPDGAACNGFESSCAYPARCHAGRCTLPGAISCGP